MYDKLLKACKQFEKQAFSAVPAAKEFAKPAPSTAQEDEKPEKYDYPKPDPAIRKNILWYIQRQLHLIGFKINKDYKLNVVWSDDLYPGGWSLGGFGGSWVGALKFISKRSESTNENVEDYLKRLIKRNITKNFDFAKPHNLDIYLSEQ